MLSIMLNSSYLFPIYYWSFFTKISPIYKLRGESFNDT